MHRTNSAPAETGCRPFTLLLGGLALGIFSLLRGCNEIRYSTSGRLTEGRITYSWTATGRNGSSQRSYYDFVADGKTYSGTSGDHTPGDRIMVEYLPDNPDVHREPGQDRWFPFGLILLLVSVGMIVAGVLDFRSTDDLLSD